MLLAALSIFITDPSMDWIKDIQRQKNDNLGNERIRTVEDKLACLDPTEIIVSLLDKIFRDKSIAKKMKPLVLDHKLAKEDLNPEGVARCLVNLAADGSILSRAYVGWKPHL